MPQVFSNNARALLVSGISDTATSLTVEAGKADLFPTANVGTGAIPSTNNWFKVTLQDALGTVEIVYVRTRTAGSAVFSNVLRGQEGTTARNFIAGTVVGLRLTAMDVEGSIAAALNSVQLTGNQTIAGTKTFSSTIAGSINGNAATVTNGVYTTGDQTIGGSKTFSSVLTNSAGRFTTNNTGLGMYEMHLPGVAARAWYLSTDGITRLGTTNGAGVTSTVLAAINATGDLTATGNVTAYSDIRLKKDLHVITHALDKLRRLTGYTYTRIDTGERQTGLVAQDVERVLPEAVVSGEHLSVAYGNLAGLMVEAIKELDKRVELLEG